MFYIANSIDWFIGAIIVTQPVQTWPRGQPSTLPSHTPPLPTHSGGFIYFLSTQFEQHRCNTDYRLYQGYKLYKCLKRKHTYWTIILGFNFSINHLLFSFSCTRPFTLISSRQTDSQITRLRKYRSILSIACEFA